jgi:hypothetical protein
MIIYNQLKSVPIEFLKTIQAGRLKGMSDIKPQWRILRLTEVFGECGFGWKITDLQFTYKENENEVVCNCHLNFYYKLNGEWSEPIPATGGSKFSTVERNGIYVSDESEKMAYTDAISVATKMIGLASDVYMGYGSKYTQPVPTAPTAPTAPTVPTQKPTLIVLDDEKNFTKQWINVTEAIKAGKIKNVEQIKNVYNISPIVEVKLNELLPPQK